MVSCCRLLAVRSFVLEVQSWSSNNVPVNLYRINVVLRPDGKKQSPKAQLSPSKVPGLAKRRQISAGSSFRARFPHPAQLSSLRARHPSQLVFSLLPQAAQMGRPDLTDYDPDSRPLLGSLRDRDRGEVHHCLKLRAQPVGSLGEVSGALQDVVPSLFPEPSSSPA